MLFQFRRNREQHARNRAKAKALIDRYGPNALVYVKAQIDAAAWEIRRQDHWRRIEQHIKKLLS